MKPNGGDDIKNCESYARQSFKRHEDVLKQNLIITCFYNDTYIIALIIGKSLIKQTN